jgi:hypothetical protein
LASEHKSQFVSSVSHELRTPLNAIIGLTEMMVKNAARFGTEKAQEPLQRVNRAGTHLLGLINQVLDLSKIEAGKLELNPQTVQLRPLIKDVIDTAGQLAEQNKNRRAVLLAVYYFRTGEQVIYFGVIHLVYFVVVLRFPPSMFIYANVTAIVDGVVFGRVPRSENFGPFFVVDTGNVSGRHSDSSASSDAQLMPCECISHLIGHLLASNAESLCCCGRCLCPTHEQQRRQ